MKISFQNPKRDLLVINTLVNFPLKVSERLHSPSPIMPKENFLTLTMYGVNFWYTNDATVLPKKELVELNFEKEKHNFELIAISKNGINMSYLA